jgi:RTX calcium-binding nonapeptide repeat (4 copies)/BNR repeat-like domain
MRTLALVLAGLLLGTAAAAARTIVGTPGNDRLVGTPRADTMAGRAGSDRLSGAAGPDLLLGGPGQDRVEAGPGNDRVSVEYDGARDSVTCGAGTDVVNADPLDTVAGDCELVGRRLSRDPYTNADSQHETEVEPDSFTFGSTTVATFQVGRRFDGAATNIGYAVTANDGRTWTSGLLPGLTIASRPAGPNARASDPVVAYDSAHGVWLISTLALEGRTTRLAINRSTDGGSTWDDARVAAEEAAPQGIAFDKNWIACDNTPGSVFYGRCYLAYTHSSDADMLAVTYTNDGGLSWSPPTDIGARPAVGVFPVVRPNGDLVVVYLWEARPVAVAASRSVDGGASFAPPVRIAEVGTFSCRIPGFRAFPLPSADVDSAGRVWATWHDCQGPRAPANDVFVATSTDGSSWTSRVPATAGRNAVLPAIGIDTTTGRAAIAYHRVGPAGVDVELVESRGETTRWGPARRLSARSMQLAWMPETTSGRMLGDYISVHYAGGRPLVAWVLASEPVGARRRQAVYATRG